jgi:hypothetical protein
MGMKIIIISNRKYRFICAKLMELEERLKVIPPDRENKKVDSDDIGDVYIDSEKVCELLCISGRTLLRLCKRYRINSTRVAHRCYYPLSEIEKLFEHRSIAFNKEIKERLKREWKRLKGQNDNENLDSHELH